MTGGRGARSGTPVSVAPWTGHIVPATGTGALKKATVLPLPRLPLPLLPQQYPRPVAVLGTVQLKTGAERLLVNEANTVRMFRVDPSKGEGWLTGAIDPPTSAETSFSDMKAPTGELQAIGMPDILAAGEIIGLWDARKADAAFFYALKLVALVESKSGVQAKDVDQAAKDLVLKGQNYHLTIVDPRSQGFKTLWQSEAFDGRVLDITLNDARSGDRGLTVLTESPDGKGRSLYFYKLL